MTAEQIGALLNLIPPVIGLACMVIWIINLVKWDGKGCKPGEDCESCPFPCEEHEKQNEKE